MLSTAEARNLVEARVLSKQGIFAPSSFEISSTIYRIRLTGSFISTLINGGEEEVGFWAPAGHNRYSILLRYIGLLSGNSSAYWFYAIDSDEGKCSLSWIRPARIEPGGNYLDAPLDQFEIEPAPVGGGAYLGLIAESGKWLLLHSHYCEQEFEISIHGPISFCNDLCKMLRPLENAEDEGDAGVT